MHAFEITLLKRNFSQHLIIAAFMSFPLRWKNMHAFEAVRSREDYRNAKKGKSVLRGWQHRRLSAGVDLATEKRSSARLPIQDLGFNLN